MTKSSKAAAGQATIPPFPDLGAPAMDYLTDAAQRTLLFWDVMRQRSNQYKEHLSQTVPHVLDYDVELVMDGRALPRPVNYLLARVLPPDGAVADQRKRPFVVIDPRAGHGPGIGGFKADSEIGVAMKAGHPCYFVGFMPEPEPGQTIADIVEAENRFIEKVQELHPYADGKPCVIGNCQAGWSLMMAAAVKPQQFGPLIVAGSPLSYWAGVRGQYPMRYSGGLLGGSWLAALASDLGNGKFDGAWLVQNFENQNPANTLWTKQYNLYSKIDTEAERYLGFERWWGAHVNLNAEEIQFIVDELFVGNNLAAGRIQMPDGTAVDLRNIRSPIVVFCSKGDNITPPQQALGWLLDLYDDTGDIRSFGQTIVYTVHETVGHLGIFVSAGVARKEHGEFSSNIDLIDALPPGLYEAVFEKRSGSTHAGDHAEGDWVMRCEARTLDDIRAMGGNDAADDRRFATAARVSEMNLSLYRTFMQPWVKAFSTPLTAEWLRAMHPLRLQYEMFSDGNPMMATVRHLAEQARENRKPADPANPFLKLQETVSSQIVAALDGAREKAERMSEEMFLHIYGLPALQSAMGIDPASDVPQRKVAKDPLHRELQAQRVAELRARMKQGGTREAVIRSVLYAGLHRASIDERGFDAIRQARENNSEMSLEEFKATVRDQFLMLIIDWEEALSTLPGLLPDDVKTRREAFAIVKNVLSAGQALSDTDRERLQQVEGLFGLSPRKVAASSKPVPIAGRSARKAS